MAQHDSKIILALDFPQLDLVKDFVAKLTPQLCRLKIGNILFTRYGPRLVEMLMRQGFEVFLDLKFHDIPQTVAGACRSAAELGVWMVNLHVMSGVAALQAARELVDHCQHKPLLIGVTVLTSLIEADLAEVGMQGSISERVLQMASLAKQHGLDGVVCSPREIAVLRQQLGDAFLLVTPGIRFVEQAGTDDQKRTLTPAAAIQAGASYLVVGRPVTQAPDPIQVLQRLHQESF